METFIGLNVVMVSCLLGTVVQGGEFSKRFLRKFCGNTCSDVTVVSHFNQAAIAGDCPGQLGIVISKQKRGKLCIGSEGTCQLRPGDNIRLGPKLSPAKPFNTDICISFNYKHASPGIETGFNYRGQATVLQGTGSHSVTDTDGARREWISMLFEIKDSLTKRCYIKVTNFRVSQGACV